MQRDAMDSSSRKRRFRWAIILALAATAVGLGGVFLERIAYVMTVDFHLPALAKAAFFYQQRYGDLPDNLATMEATGLCRPDAYRLPASGWEVLLTNTRSGPAPFYAPVHGWDGTTQFIIAVQAKTDRWGGPVRRYVVLADTPVRSATEGELARLLEEDDARRQEAGQDARWGGIEWRKTGAD